VYEPGYNVHSTKRSRSNLLMALSNVPFTQLSRDGIPRPWLRIVIKNPHTGKEMRTYGLIDTGADECALPASFAPILGHDLQKGTEKRINTGNGETIAYSHTMSLEIDDIRINDILIDFMPNLDVVLLGVKSFLAKFTLTVDYPKKEFSII